MYIPGKIVEHAHGINIHEGLVLFGQTRQGEKKTLKDMDMNTESQVQENFDVVLPNMASYYKKEKKKTLKNMEYECAEVTTRKVWCCRCTTSSFVTGRVCL